MTELLADGRHLVLASTSRYRRELLARLGLPFAARAPDCDETPLSGEGPAALVARLAQAKAASFAAYTPHALVIGSDQVAVLDGRILGKPGDHARATQQLTAAAGARVEFLTGLALVDADSGRVQCEVVRYAVQFRALTPAQIERYLQRERPYDCAGSFKSEGLGIALFERLEGEDPNALIGLPLIRLVAMLAAEGVEVP